MLPYHRRAVQDIEPREIGDSNEKLFQTYLTGPRRPRLGVLINHAG
jgi:hypothetical protein